MEYLIEAAKLFGLPGLVFFYFIGQNHLADQRAAARELVLVARLRELEDKVESYLVGALRDSTSASLKQAEALSTLTHVIKSRPCLYSTLPFQEAPHG